MKWTNYSDENMKASSPTLLRGRREQDLKNRIKVFLKRKSFEFSWPEVPRLGD
jgi:hypothetical protein